MLLNSSGCISLAAVLTLSKLLTFYVKGRKLIFSVNFMKSFSGQKLLKSLIQKHAINANTEFCFPAKF